MHIYHHLLLERCHLYRSDHRPTKIKEVMRLKRGQQRHDDWLTFASFSSTFGGDSTSSASSISEEPPLVSAMKF